MATQTHISSFPKQTGDQEPTTDPNRHESSRLVDFESPASHNHREGPISTTTLQLLRRKASVLEHVLLALLFHFDIEQQHGVEFRDTIRFDFVIETVWSPFIGEEWNRHATSHA